MTPTVRPARLDPRSPLVLDAHELGRRPGAMRTVERTVPAPADLGTAVLGVPAGSPLLVSVRLESVMEGVLVTGEIHANAAGECVRCLDPVQTEVRAQLQELYRYAETSARDARDTRNAEGLGGDGGTGGDDGEDELPTLEGDLLDLEPAVRDAVVTALPFQPTCSGDCPGLCARCGARLADDPDHAHDDTDPRWAALAGLAAQLADPGSPAASPPGGSASPAAPTTPTPAQTTDPRQAAEEPN